MKRKQLYGINVCEVKEGLEGTMSGRPISERTAYFAMELWISLLLDFHGISAEWIIGPDKFARIWNRLLELDEEKEAARAAAKNQTNGE